MTSKGLGARGCNVHSRDVLIVTATSIGLVQVQNILEHTMTLSRHCGE